MSASGNNLAENKPFYIAAWKHVLVDWLHWPDERFERWIKVHEVDLEDRGNPLFYHLEALGYVKLFLIPDRLALRLDAMRNEGTPPSHRLASRLEGAIGPGTEVTCNPEFDWNAARERVEAALKEYGEALPGPDNRMNYVRWRLGEDCP